MASLPSDNPYTVQGTVLYEVIPSDAYRAQMLGKTNISTPTDEALAKSSTTAAVTFKGVAGSGSRGAAAGRSAASSNLAAASHRAGADGHLLSSSAASATAALRAQREQQYQSALAGSFSGVTRSGAVLGGGHRTGPAASILLPGASKVAVGASRKPGRLAPLGSEETTESGGGGGGAMMTAAADGSERTKAGPSATGQSLTVERALAQLFPPVAIASSRNSTEGTDEETCEDVKGQALSATRPDKEGSRVPTPPPEWMQVAATDHISRIDVVLLHQHLLQRCQDEHARPAGSMCATREAIFNDGYQELMRQVTVMCPERGLLLEELDQNMALSSEAYDTLFDSACQYAARKSIERDLRSYLFDDKKKLGSEVRRLENRVNELRAKHDGLLKRFEEQKASTQKVQEEELSYLKKANQQLISEIKRLSTMESAMNAATKASAEGS